MNRHMLTQIEGYFIMRKNRFSNFIATMLLLCASSNLKAAGRPDDSKTVYYIDGISASTRWGIEFTGQGWTMDGKEFLNDMNTWDAVTTDFGLGMTGKVASGRLGGAASLFVEGNSLFCMGAAVGYGVMPAVSSKLRLTGISSYLNMDLNNELTYIPGVLYLKYTSEGGKFSLFGGGGADYVMASTNYQQEEPGYLVKATFTQKKVMPHVQAGFELFLTEGISFNLNAKYLFNAVLDNLTGNLTVNGAAWGKYRMIMDGNSFSPYGDVVGFSKTSNPLVSGERPFKYDLSGPRTNVSLRVYF